MGLKERNFLGEGKKLRFEANLSEKKNTYNIGVTEPYFLDRHLSLFGNIYDQESENSKGDVKTNKTGFDFGVGFKLNDISQTIKYNFSTSETTTAALLRLHLRLEKRVKKLQLLQLLMVYFKIQEIIISIQHLVIDGSLKIH